MNLDSGDGSVDHGEPCGSLIFVSQISTYDEPCLLIFKILETLSQIMMHALTVNADLPVKSCDMLFSSIMINVRFNGWALKQTVS